MAEHNNLTKYFEEIAKEKLACFVDERFQCLELKDKPDLQSEELDIGIEVTRCLNKKDKNKEDEEDEGATEAFVRETFGSNMSFEERKEIMRKTHASGELYQSVPSALRECRSEKRGRRSSKHGSRSYRSRGVPEWP